MSTRFASATFGRYPHVEQVLTFQADRTVPGPSGPGEGVHVRVIHGGRPLLWAGAEVISPSSLTDKIDSPCGSSAIHGILSSVVQLRPFARTARAGNVNRSQLIGVLKTRAFHPGKDERVRPAAAREPWCLTMKCCLSQAVQ